MLLPSVTIIVIENAFSNSSSGAKISGIIVIKTKGHINITFIVRFCFVACIFTVDTFETRFAYQNHSTIMPCRWRLECTECISSRLRITSSKRSRVLGMILVRLQIWGSVGYPLVAITSMSRQTGSCRICYRPIQGSNIPHYSYSIGILETI